MTILRRLCALSAILAVAAAVPLQSSSTQILSRSKGLSSSASVPTIAPTHYSDESHYRDASTPTRTLPASKGCTFHLGLPAATNLCGDGTSTVYTATHTSRSALHCYGCDTLHFQTPDLAARAMTSCAAPSVTITAPTAFTTWKAECSPSSSTQITSSPLSLPPTKTHSPQDELRRRDVAVEAAAALQPEAACPTTLTILPTTKKGGNGVLTLFQKTTTTTTLVPCGGCTLQVMSNLYGPGPQVIPSATIRVAAITATAYACM